MLKILQTRLQQYVNQELQDIQAGFRKGKETRDQIANIIGSWRKQRSSRKTFTSSLLTMLTPLCGPQQLWKTLKEMGISDHFTCVLRNCMQVKKEQLELDMEKLVQH